MVDVRAPSGTPAICADIRAPHLAHHLGMRTAYYRTKELQKDVKSNIKNTGKCTSIPPRLLARYPTHV